jgi:hypothetical protein
MEIWRRLGQNRSLLYETQIKISRDTLPLPKKTEIQQSLASFGVKTLVQLQFRCKNANDKNTELLNMLPTLKFRFRVRNANGANVVTNTLSR